ncbi:hypothetical protein QVD17_38954 [Tagetes erecta]|uniref:C2H2-type domain-containing protein n=1 Tax=Tagetes erecta TaxID=13708 RepID=A0AAD8N9T4_TARER|nr:hypothetical protein QVD17_38954 [Tagetes erecta]
MEHMCRFCNKIFPCGRSLGGHMRSHVINSTHHHHHHHVQQQHHDDEVKNKSCSSVLDKLCKECGKGFQSWKALFGHMKCHSTKLSNNKNKNLESLDQDSWTSNSENEDFDSKKRRKKRAGSRSRSGSRRNKRYMVTTASSSISMNVNCNQISCNNNNNNASTSMVSEIEQEQEAEVAMSLMMLSRDLGSWGNELESSGYCYNSSVLEQVEGKDSVTNRGKTNKFAETEVGFDFLERSDVGLNKIHGFDSGLSEFKDLNKKKFKCVTCNKSFLSHQALCGHKASHQKLKKEFDAKIQSENKIEHKPELDRDQTINGCDSRTSNEHQESSSFNLDDSFLKRKTVVSKAHKCSICFKVFTSGQALGGHKRSHFISEAKLNQENNTNVIKKPDEVVRKTRGFLDLNMLPEEEMNMSSSTTEYKSYYWEDSSEHHSHESKMLCLLSTS